LHSALENYAQPHGKAALVSRAAGTADLLLIFVFTPFLIYPLQESLLRAQPPHFLGAIRRVLQRSVMLSGIVQALVLVAPGALMDVLAGLLRWDPLSRLQWTNLTQMLFVSSFILMIFATPAVVLDGEGPLHSLRTSVHLLS